jgi:acetaldehyde dehydrogenase (acetylating)
MVSTTQVCLLPTRQNIDESRYNNKGLEVIGGAKQGKAIIILSHHPILMRNDICPFGPEDVTAKQLSIG